MRVEASLIVCEECGLAHRWQPPEHGAVARCTRCDAVLDRSHRLSIDSILALTVAAAATYLVAVNAPLLTLTLRGPAAATSLVDAIQLAWTEGEPLIAIVAGLTALVAPAAFVGLRLFTVGVLLSLVRLAALAHASPGVGLFALGALTVLFASIQSAGLKRLWWQVE
jgi:paraquat-inducible protein A